MQLSTIERRSDKRALAARVGQYSCFPASFSGRVSAYRACGSRDVSTNFDVAADEIIHSLLIHDEHHQAGALSADLRTPANSGNRERRRRTPIVRSCAASRYSGSVLATYHESCLYELRNNGDALC